jgi:hypothetical protein
MASLTPGQIVDALASDASDRLIGTTESDRVDFKLAPYLLTENHQKWELAKDVAAFCEQTGYIVACNRFQSNRVSLPAGQPGPRNFFGGIYGDSPNASSDAWERVFDEVGTAGGDTFQALQRVYALFGHPPAAIPLVENNAVSENALVALP